MAMLVGLPGWQQLLIILVIVIILFGGARIAGIGKASGKAIREFKDELRGPDGAETGGTQMSTDSTATPPPGPTETQ